ncbi:MAG: MFS transporter [Verrucomicrobiae bacterium]|nr:MFS transporter [Verrucomicrobiae bacterium]
MTTRARLRLADYFGYEAVSAFSCTIFLYCVFFWTRARFGFSDAQNLFLTSLHGLIYLLAARFGGRLSDRFGYDRVLLLGAAGMSLILGTGWLFQGWAVPFGVVALYTVFIAPTWPALEAAILHTPGKATMPNRLGFYNLTWALGDALGFFVAGLLFEWNRDAILWVPGLFHLAQLGWMRWAPSRRVGGGEPAMEIGHRGDEIPHDRKRRFMHVAWLANGLGYLMNAAFFALAPQLGERLDWPAHWTIWLSCSLLFTRTLGFALFWRWEGWHYHMAWLQAALWAGPVCLAVAFFAADARAIFTALALFGLALALVYAASIYYTLDYGEHKGESGGVHEAVLGIGVFVGPLLAAMAAAAAGAVAAQVVTVLLAFAANAAGLFAIARLARRA